MGDAVWAGGFRLLMHDRSSKDINNRLYLGGDMEDTFDGINTAPVNFPSIYVNMHVNVMPLTHLIPSRIPHETLLVDRLGPTVWRPSLHSH